MADFIAINEIKDYIDSKYTVLNNKITNMSSNVTDLTTTTNSRTIYQSNNTRREQITDPSNSSNSDFHAAGRTNSTNTSIVTYEWTPQYDGMIRLQFHVGYTRVTGLIWVKDVTNNTNIWTFNSAVSGNYAADIEVESNIPISINFGSAVRDVDSSADYCNYSNAYLCYSVESTAKNVVSKFSIVDQIQRGYNYYVVGVTNGVETKSNTFTVGLYPYVNPDKCFVWRDTACQITNFTYNTIAFDQPCNFEIIEFR